LCNFPPSPVSPFSHFVLFPVFHHPACKTFLSQIVCETPPLHEHTTPLPFPRLFSNSRDRALCYTTFRPVLHLYGFHSRNPVNFSDVSLVSFPICTAVAALNCPSFCDSSFLAGLVGQVPDFFPVSGPFCSSFVPNFFSKPRRCRELPFSFFP